MWTDEMQSELDQIFVLAALLDYEVVWCIDREKIFEIWDHIGENVLEFNLSYGSYKVTQVLHNGDYQEFCSIEHGNLYPLQKMKELL